jgi:hypothetical protein
MKLAQRKQEAAQLLRDMKQSVESLPEPKRTELIVALKEIFSELDEAAATDVAASRSATQCFARV